MGAWTRAAGAVFLDWLQAPAGAYWLDVGCGTGAFTQLVLDRCSPASLFAVDPAEAQIDHALRQPVARGAKFRVADAQALPFPDSKFDMVSSALVINFIPEPRIALGEMRRVARRGGFVAGYVWDFAAERSPSWPLRLGMRQVGGDVPDVPGTQASSLGALTSLFQRAGLEDVQTKSMDVLVPFRDFDTFWQSQMQGHSPITKAVTEMNKSERVKLIDKVQACLPMSRDGRIEYCARANLVKARTLG
jgi:SAM-dependent methyltransferase